MEGKYNNWPRYLGAYAYRQWIRKRIEGMVSWSAAGAVQPGCTALIGMCHRLPDVLLGNLSCLNAASWPELTEAIVVVDSTEGCLPKGLEAAAQAACTNFKVRFLYYSAKQAKLTEELCLPYVFSWLSWSIALSHCTTRSAMLHDYDALVLGDTLARRYYAFVESGAAIQGVRWYQVNGITAEDRLAGTFEAFLDVPWLRSFRPIQMFNQVGYAGGRSRDYDTLLDIQHRHTAVSRRTVIDMDEESLVHPSQMIHQYTMFRRSPGSALPCFSIPMIPVFELLSGKQDALGTAAKRINAANGKIVDFFGDGARINLAQLDTASVDWILKQIARVCMARQIGPFRDFADYGTALYKLAASPDDKAWLGDFTALQRTWIDQSRGLVRRDRDSGTS